MLDNNEKYESLNDVIFMIKKINKISFTKNNKKKNIYKTSK